MEYVDFQGKTDPLILKESLHMMGYDDKKIEESIDTLKQKYFQYLKEHLNTNGDAVLLPGIIEILNIISKDDTILTGLLTGNFKESAFIKLDRFDLNHFFSFGVFGDDAAIRDMMPPIARQKITDDFNVEIDFSNMIIIGDTKYDIQCARVNGAVSITVGTGWGDKEKLLEEKPDFFFDDLSDVDEVMQVIADI